MPRDYKQRPRSREKKTVKQRSPWIYFAAGMLAGVAATVVVYFNELVPVPLYIAPEKSGPARQAAASLREREAPKDDAPKPRFEFYTMLPEMEVAVPEAELKPRARSAPESASGSGTFYLQAGSFRRPEEAEKMKATLAFLGLESSIQTVTINGADTWHRVRIGPFSDLASLNDARKRLKKNEIESIVLKVRG